MSLLNCQPKYQPVGYGSQPRGSVLLDGHGISPHCTGLYGVSTLLPSETLQHAFGQLVYALLSLGWVDCISMVMWDTMMAPERSEVLFPLLLFCFVETTTSTGSSQDIYL